MEVPRPIPPELIIEALSFEIAECEDVARDMNQQLRDGHDYRHATGSRIKDLNTAAQFLQEGRSFEGATPNINKAALFLTTRIEKLRQQNQP